ncbi:MAG: O-methyltransferase [Verrucomicrobiia bacterium]
MKKAISIFCGVVLMVQCWNGSGADSNTINDEAREEFIKNFKRIGLNTTPGDAMMLRILVEASKAKRGVEVGTATGYGAINMGVGFERNGGHLYTIDIDPQMVKTARENIKKAGLEKTVTVIEGDALKVLPTLEGEFDFVFIDALKRDYFKYFQAISPKLKKGALVVADNVIQSAKDMRDFLDYMENSKDYEKVIIRASVEKNDGMGIYLKIR